MREGGSVAVIVAEATCTGCTTPWSLCLSLILVPCYALTLLPICLIHNILRHVLQSVRAFVYQRANERK